MGLLDYTDERYVQQRSNALSRELDLRRVEAMAVACAERGLSVSGSTHAMSASESTIEDYRELAMAKYGFEILEQKVDDKSGLPEYEKVAPDYYRSRHRTEWSKWVGLVLDHEAKLPAEWVGQVRENALEDGIRLTE